MSQFARKIKSFITVTSSATVLFGSINLYKGNEKFYDDVLMPMVQNIPPEASHKIAVLACKYKLFSGPDTRDSKSLTTKFFGRTLKNPLGIAAGFDKQGEAVEGLQKIGFGFIEIGSVTPLPQPGNPKPRVFRLPLDKAIINRYGFNSDGHEEVYNRLKHLKDENTFNGVLGINLGKNKESPDALSDYVQGVEVFGPIADYLVVNISSPNTPGLRNLQSKKDLEVLLSGILNARNGLPKNNNVPVFLKIAPDLTKEDVKNIVQVINQKNCRVDGLIISNTTVDKSNLITSELSEEDGGLSGAPLKMRSTNLIAEVYSMTKGKIPIIGVGGIFTGEDAYEKILAGASYVQLYTALIYHGPPVVHRIKNELSELLEENGYANVAEAVGKEYKRFLNK